MCWRRRWRAYPMRSRPCAPTRTGAEPAPGMLVRSSRRLSRVEQAQNPIACAVRNLGMRYAPMRSLTRQTTRPMRFDLGWTT